MEEDSNEEEEVGESKESEFSKEGENVTIEMLQKLKKGLEVSKSRLVCFYRYQNSENLCLLLLLILLKCNKLFTLFQKNSLFSLRRIMRIFHAAVMEASDDDNEKESNAKFDFKIESSSGIKLIFISFSIYQDKVLREFCFLSSRIDKCGS